jgi:hypothetical protein
MRSAWAAAIVGSMTDADIVAYIASFPRDPELMELEEDDE